jgi:ArsR family metal-binding transcriptional regulator
MLLHDYRITKVGRSLCNPDWLAVIAELDNDISEVLPYLNAVIKNAVYTPQARNLNFRMDRGLISVMPRQIGVGQVTSEGDAIQVFDYVKQLINDTWEGRAGIIPIYHRKEELKARDILDFLPKTNCRECGLPTCFAFAVALLKGQKHLQGCPALARPEHALDSDALARLLQTASTEEVPD